MERHDPHRKTGITQWAKVNRGCPRLGFLSLLPGNPGLTSTARCRSSRGECWDASRYGTVVAAWGDHVR